MTAIAKVIARAPGVDRDVEAFSVLAVFCGTGLAVSLLLASYGVDLSAGFF